MKRRGYFWYSTKSGGPGGDWNRSLVCRLVPSYWRMPQSGMV